MRMKNEAGFFLMGDTFQMWVGVWGWSEGKNCLPTMPRKLWAFH